MRFRPARGARNARIAAGVAIGGGLLASGISSLYGKAVSTADPYSGASVNFPTDLEINDHWIEFKAEEQKGLAINDFAVGGRGLKGTTINGGTIRLPMPASLSTDYNPQYTEQDLGSAAGMALKPFDRAMYGNKDIESEANMGTAMGALSLGAGVFQGAALQGAQSALSNAGGQGGEAAFATALKVFGGAAVNPHKVVLFTGVGFRDHTFSWKLSPRSRRESNDIHLICEMFKFYSHPEYLAGGLFFKYPEFFRIRFRHRSYLFELEPSVCTDVRIDYHGQGFPAYIRDFDGSGIPAPAEITLSLTFKETEVITKNTLTRGERITAPRIMSTPRDTVDPGTGAFTGNLPEGTVNNFPG